MAGKTETLEWCPLSLIKFLEQNESPPTITKCFLKMKTGEGGDDYVYVNMWVRSCATLPDRTCRPVEATWWRAAREFVEFHLDGSSLHGAEEAYRDICLWEMVHQSQKERTGD